MRFTSAPMGLTLLSAISTAFAHSWLDDLTVVGGASIASTLGSKGYIRNYQGHVDSTSSYRIEDPTLAAPACAQFQQSSTSYTNALYPQLTAFAGDYIQGAYLENGHISKKELPETQSGTTYWFGTADNSLQPTLAEVMAWKDGGDGAQGKLLAGPTDFDDGTCVEDNGTPEAIKRKAAGGGGPCKSTFKLPEDLQPGSTYTVYWVWDFSLHFGPQKVGHTEWYTSCVDIKIGGNTSTATAAAAAAGNKSTRSIPRIRGRVPAARL
ncbi:hypothetical protein BZA05DRAFT_190576 [Tricharina praecox]|uniref:uncharacterized protein n=1 Tax=Tricharina praecox TaxID=43433 RepID=UPI00221F49F9|nr:uncharacterized protein BZA05DRAFT_190576 [Tricharina praecox]KAI5842779.1 hypothetical protein BZA05DRAFT_190576 [Tricharina praecox]